MANLDHVTKVIVRIEISIVYDLSRTIDRPLSIEKSYVIHYETKNPLDQ